MFTVTSPDAQLKEAQGKYQSLTWEVESTTSVVGETIYVVPSLWASSQQSNLPGVPSISFSAVYTPGLNSEMTLNGVGDIWKNGRVILEYVNAKNFKIHLRFINVADTLGSLGANSINNNDRFVSKSYAGSQTTVYDVTRYLALQIYSSGGNAGVSNINYSAQPSRTTGVNYVISAGSQNADGFSLVDDTLFAFEIEDTNIGTDYFVGIFRVDPEPTNGQDYPTDLNLQFASIDGGISQADQFPYAKITSSTDIQNIGGKFIGAFGVDVSYFQSGFTYKFIIAYNKGGQWYSFVSDDIEQKSSELTPDAVYGNISYAVETYDSNSNTYPASNVCGISPYERVRLAVAMDKPSYLVLAQTNGASGNFDDNLVSVDIYIADSVLSTRDGDINFNSPGVIQPAVKEVTGVDVDSDIYQVLTEFRVPSGWAGLTKYVNFIWTFDMGDYFDFINTPMILNMASEVTDAVSDPVFSGEFTDVICNDLESAITLDLDLAASSNYDIVPIILKNGKALEEDLYTNDNFDQLVQSILSGDASAISSDTELQYTIDPTQLDARAEYCLRFVFKEELSDVSNPDGGDCDCFDFDATQTVESFNNFTTQLKFEFDAVSEIAALSTTVINWSVKAIGPNGNVLALENFTEASGEMTFEYPTPLFAEVDYEFLVTLENGCRYDAAFNMQSLVDNNVVRQITMADICDPPDANLYSAGCLNYPTIELSCDDINDQIIATKGGTILSTEISDVLSYSLTGFDGEFSDYSSPIDASEAWFKRYVEFSDGCPAVTIFKHIKCSFEELECADDIELSTVYDADAQTLTISKTGTVSCGYSSDDIEYSSDDGLNFDPYVSPIDVSLIDELILKRTLECSDGCPTVLHTETWNKSAKINCNYSDFDLSAAFDAGLNIHSALRINLDSDLDEDKLEYSVDGGEVFQDYTGGVSADVVLFKRTLEYPGCEPHVITKVSARDCCVAATGDFYVELFTPTAGTDEVTTSNNVSQIIGVYRNGVLVKTDIWSRVGNTITFSDRNFASGEWIVIQYK